jgi:hypothetical protein
MHEPEDTAASPTESRPGGPGEGMGTSAARQRHGEPRPYREPPILPNVAPLDTKDDEIVAPCTSEKNGVSEIRTMSVAVFGDLTLILRLLVTRFTAILREPRHKQRPATISPCRPGWKPGVTTWGIAA